MKKPLVVACVIVVICSLITVSILLKQPADTSQGNPESTPTATPQSTLQPTPQNTTQPTPQATPTTTPQPTPNGQLPETAIQQAIDKAIENLKATEQPYCLLMLNVIYRQFGIAEFNDTLQRYDHLLAANSDPTLRVFRRMAAYNNTVNASDFNAIADPINRLTYPALYADKITPPTNYPAMLQSARESGGYQITHALLATIWLNNNHCTLQFPNNFLQSLYHDTAALTQCGSIVTDINFEAAAFLCEAGQGSLVDQGFLQKVLDTQNYDGGWLGSSDQPGASYWHSSVLALMYLLYVEYPAVSYPPMIPSA